jgi:hypothetical protein
MNLKSLPDAVRARQMVPRALIRPSRTTELRKKLLIIENLRKRQVFYTLIW